MLLSNIPAKILAAFANAGSKRTVPTASQVSITPGAASYADGFPPLNSTPISAGGIPPDIRDMNGILNAVTAIQQWQCGGGLFVFDSAWSTANGGYPKGAVLLKADGTGLWFNQVDSNTVNPDTVGTNWLSLDGSTLSAAAAVATSAEAQAGTSTTKAVTPKGLADTMLGGVGQTWQNKTSSRSSGTTWTNTSGRPILVLITLAGTSQVATVSVNGSAICTMSTPPTGSQSINSMAAVPNGGTYRLDFSSGSGFSTWYELA